MWLLETHYLTDGGIFDNLGVAQISYLLDAQRWLGNDVRQQIVKSGFTFNPYGAGTRRTRPAHVVVSDASARFHDVVRPFETKCGATYQPQAAEIQALVPLTRADLDQFDPDLVRCLARHGHEVAAQVCARLKGQEEELPSDVPWDPQPGRGRTDVAGLVRLLERQHSRFRWQENLFGIFNPRDPVCWIYAASVIGVIVAVISRMRRW